MKAIKLTFAAERVQPRQLAEVSGGRGEKESIISRRMSASSYLSLVLSPRPRRQGAGHSTFSVKSSWARRTPPSIHDHVGAESRKLQIRHLNLAIRIVRWTSMPAALLEARQRAGRYSDRLPLNLDIWPLRLRREIDDAQLFFSRKAC
jgi:hypothetical protein